METQNTELYAQAVTENESSVTVNVEENISQLNSVLEIKSFIANKFIQNESVIELYEINTTKSFEAQFSKASFESILFYTIAYVIYVVKQLFKLHKVEVDTMLTERTPHTLEWWRNIALKYRHGYALLPDSDKYPEEAINNESAAIITYCAVSKGAGELVIKIASGGDTLQKLNESQYLGFQEYMEPVGDAGVQLNIISDDADSLKLVIDTYYNPMVLDGDGKRLDGSNDTPLLDGANVYLQNLTFDGYFSLTDLTDALQKIEGLESTRVVGVQTKWGLYEWSNVINKYRAHAGWLKIYDLENDLTVNYHANISD